jgi:ATP-dependent DNA ligase
MSLLIDRKEEMHGRQDVALQASSADAEAATQAQAEKADGEKTDRIISVLIGIVSKRLGSLYRSGRSPHWIKVKNPKAPAVKREAEEDWGRK